MVDKFVAIDKATREWLTGPTSFRVANDMAKLYEEETENSSEIFKHEDALKRK